MTLFQSLLRRPYVLVLIVLLVAADIGGVVHAFRAHGRNDGIIALVLPPYGLYRAGESLTHHTSLTDADVEALSKTPEGRGSLTAGLKLKPEVWTALIGMVEAQPSHQIKTTMEETGVPYDITADVEPNGPVTLTIQSRSNTDLEIGMIDMDRDQNPDTMKIVRQVNKKPEVHVTPLSKFSPDDATEFVLAWSLAWGTIADEQKVVAPLLPVSR